ncbi:hypothetical protein GGI18_005949, partial [Coemansia linderi]
MDSDYDLPDVVFYMVPEGDGFMCPFRITHAASNCIEQKKAKELIARARYGYTKAVPTEVHSQLNMQGDLIDCSKGKVVVVLPECSFLVNANMKAMSEEERTRLTFALIEVAFEAMKNN